MKKTPWILFLAISIFAIGVYYFRFYNPEVLQIGSTKILEKDVQYRDQIIQLEFPGDNRSAGLAQLKKFAYYQAILKNHGIEITDDLLFKEDERINKNTRNPDQLKKIKNLFGDDHKAYLNNFVRPTLITRTVYNDLYLKDDSTLEETYNKALEYQNILEKNPNLLSDFAQKNQLQLVPLYVSKANGVLWNPDRQQKMLGINKDTKNVAAGQINEDLHPEQMKFWMDIVKITEPNHFSKKIVDTDLNWQIVFYKGMKKQFQHQFLVLNIPKKSYDDWLKSETKKIAK